MLFEQLLHMSRAPINPPSGSYIPGGEESGALVLDIGAANVRAGFAGGDTPKVFESSLVGAAIGGMSDGDSHNTRVYPLNLYAKREHMDVSPCLLFDTRTRSVVLNSPDGLEDIMRFSLKRLGYFGESGMSHPIVVTEPNKHDQKVREKLAEILFEKFDAPGIFPLKRAVGAAFASGRESCTVVDIGASMSSVSVVSDGFCLQEPLKEFSIGGNMMDQTLLCLLKRRSGMSIFPLPFDITANMSSSFVQHSRLQFVRDLKHQYFSKMSREPLAPDLLAGWGRPPQQTDGGANSTTLELPDKTALDEKMVEPYMKVDRQPTSVPRALLAQVLPELLMDPSPLASNWPPPLAGPRELVEAQQCAPESVESLETCGFPGLVEAIAQAVGSVDIDVRRQVGSEVILCGGGSQITELPPRLLRGLHSLQASFGAVKSEQVNEGHVHDLMGQRAVVSAFDASGANLESLAAPILAKGKVTAAPRMSGERQWQSWLGASVFGCLGTAQQMWLAKKEYMEMGARRAMDSVIW